MVETVAANCRGALSADGLRRIGVLMNRASDDPEGQARMEAFQEALRNLGWTDGANVQIDIRYGEDNIDVEQNTPPNWSHLRRTSFWPAAP